jgi:hypothetical protein
MSAAVRCGSEQRSRYFPSRFVAVLILALSTRSSPPGVTRRYRFKPGLVEIFPLPVGRSAEPSLSIWPLVWTRKWAADLQKHLIVDGQACVQGPAFPQVEAL